MLKDEKLKRQINQSIYEKKNYKHTLKTKNKKRKKAANKRTIGYKIDN